MTSAGSGLELALTFDEPHLFEHFLAGPTLLTRDSYLSIYGVAFWLWVLWGRIRLMKWAGGGEASGGGSRGITRDSICAFLLRFGVCLIVC